MNGYKLIADSYRKVAQGADKETTEFMEKKIRIYDFLATCDKDDMRELYNSSAFNDFIKTSCQLAIEDAGIEEEKQKEVLECLRYSLDVVGAERINDQLSGIVQF